MARGCRHAKLFEQVPREKSAINEGRAPGPYPAAKSSRLAANQRSATGSSLSASPSIRDRRRGRRPQNARAGGAAPSNQRFRTGHRAILSRPLSCERMAWCMRQFRGHACATSEKVGPTPHREERGLIPPVCGCARCADRLPAALGGVVIDGIAFQVTYRAWRTAMNVSSPGCPEDPSGDPPAGRTIAPLPARTVAAG